MHFSYCSRGYIYPVPRPPTQLISRKFSCRSDLKSPPGSTECFSHKTIHTLVEIKEIMILYQVIPFSIILVDGNAEACDMIAQYSKE